MQFQVTSDLNEIYMPVGEHQRYHSIWRELTSCGSHRIQKLQDTFKAKHGKDAMLIARSPGRVNLIGEHIDYSYYSVLPMALSDHDILIAVALTQSEKRSIRVSNVQSQIFGERVLQLDDDGQLKIDATKHEWSNYFAAGVKGVLQALQVDAEDFSLECMVDGSVPSGAGVSSSSAFVCCSALMMLAVLAQYSDDAKVVKRAQQMTKFELTQIAIASERFVGVNAGGMDQSCSVNGQRGSAVLISFYPQLQIDPVAFPPHSQEYSFVIAHSLVQADKHVTAPYQYNLRVVECAVAAHIMHRQLKLSGELKTLRDVQELMHQRSIADGQRVAVDSEQMITELLAMSQQVDNVFANHDGYNVAECASQLGLTEAELRQRFNLRSVNLEHGSVIGKLQLWSRAKHVYGEAARVYQFKKACSINDGWQAMAELMNHSQDSCRDLYQCSHPQLDQLIATCRHNGAMGSRLTGAGWGGCCVSLVPTAQLDNFMAGVKRDYYEKCAEVSQQVKQLNGDYSQVLFATTAGTGAIVYKP